MNVKMNTGLIPGFFDGTYYTRWEPEEYDENGMDEQQLEYTGSELMRSIATAYRRDQPQILRDFKFEAPFVTDVQFPGTSYSPREYNFESDVIDFILTINRAELRKSVRALKDSEHFSKHLHEHYSSRDGFISFIPNNWGDLAESLANKESSDFEQSLGALLAYLLRDELESIQESVYEYWRGNGYCGLEYTIEEPELELA